MKQTVASDLCHYRNHRHRCRHHGNHHHRLRLRRRRRRRRRRAPFLTTATRCNYGTKPAVLVGGRCGAAGRKWRVFCAGMICRVLGGGWCNQTGALVAGHRQRVLLFSHPPTSVAAATTARPATVFTGFCLPPRLSFSLPVQLAAHFLIFVPGW